MRMAVHRIPFPYTSDWTAGGKEGAYKISSRIGGAAQLVCRFMLTGGAAAWAAFSVSSAATAHLILVASGKSKFKMALKQSSLLLEPEMGPAFIERSFPTPTSCVAAGIAETMHQPI